MSAQTLYEQMSGGHWIWGLPVTVLAAVGLYYMARLSPPKSRVGALARVMLLMGFAFYIAAFCYSMLGFDRTMFGRMASYGVMSGVVLLIRQIALACIAERKKVAEDSPAFGARVLAALVEHKH